MRNVSETRQHVHALIDRIEESQIAKVADLLEAIVGDDAVTAEERAAILRAEAWFAERGGMGVPMEDVLADFGLTMDDFPLAKERGGVQD